MGELLDNLAFGFGLIGFIFFLITQYILLGLYFLARLPVIGYLVRSGLLLLIIGVVLSVISLTMKSKKKWKPISTLAMFGIYIIIEIIRLLFYIVTYAI